MSSMRQGNGLLTVVETRCHTTMFIALMLALIPLLSSSAPRFAAFYMPRERRLVDAKQIHTCCAGNADDADTDVTHVMQ